MKTTNYNIRLNPEVKADAEKTFASFGLNLSEAINVFLHMSIKRQGFPFEIREPKYRPEVYELIERIESGEEKLHGPYSSLEEMWADLDAHDEEDSDDEV